MPSQAPLRALVLGGADTLEADQAAAFKLFKPDLVIACNHAGRDQFWVDHWVSMHPNLMARWLEDRRLAGRPDPKCCWYPKTRSHLAPQNIPARPVENWGGSSGLLCVGVAFELGCSHVVLAGVPLVKQNRHYDDQRPWDEARQYRWAWERRIDELRDRVRSLSGWTLDLLGSPTGEWLHGD